MDAKANAQKNGLCSFSSATVVNGPWPGQRRVSGGRLKICSRNLLPGQFPGLMAAADGAGENGVADDGHVRRVLRPGADDVSRAVFGVARAPAQRYFQDAPATILPNE